MSKSKDLIKRHTESVTHNTLGNIITLGLAWGGAAVISALATYSGFLSGLPLYLLIFWGALIFLILAAALNFIHLFIVRRGQLKAAVNDETGLQNVEADDKRIELSNVQTETVSRDIKRLQDNNTALEIDINLRRQELEKFAWLRELAETQAKEIDEYVIVESILICDINLRDPIKIPYVEFWLNIINTSVYDITIHKDAMEGRIKFRLNKLLEGREISSHEESIPASRRGHINITQRLHTTEVGLLTPYENKKDEALPFFNLSDLVITISGGTQFPQVKEKRLRLPQDIGIKDSVYKDRVSTLEAEVSALQSELDKLKTYKLKFEIDAPRSKVCVAFAYGEGFDVSLHLYIRFINSDTYPLFVHTVSASLINKNADGTELELPKIKYELYQAAYNPELESAWQLKSWQNIDLKISERETTLYHTIKGHIDISSDHRKMLFDGNCFLRVCMEAMNQPPYSLDFDVDWDGTNRGWADITPRT